MSNESQRTVASVLRILHQQGVALEKIVLHKFIYFLNTQRVTTGFRFEPYTYGPFSFDLASTIGNMHFWDAIKENKYDVEIVNLNSYPPLPPDQEKRISLLLKVFEGIVGTFDFRNLECAGTALYCAENLSLRGIRVTEESVEKEFKAWKGERYSSEEIQGMFRRLKPYLQ